MLLSFWLIVFTSVTSRDVTAEILYRCRRTQANAIQYIITFLHFLMRYVKRRMILVNFIPDFILGAPDYLSWTFGGSRVADVRSYRTTPINSHLKVMVRPRTRLDLVEMAVGLAEGPT